METTVFFTMLGRIVAWLLLVFGCLRVALAVAVVSTTGESTYERYLGSSTTGEAIDGGLLYIVLGIALGVIAEISRSVAARTH